MRTSAALGSYFPTSTSHMNSLRAPSTQVQRAWSTFSITSKFCAISAGVIAGCAKPGVPWLLGPDDDDEAPPHPAMMAARTPTVTRNRVTAGQPTLGQSGSHRRNRWNWRPTLRALHGPLARRFTEPRSRPLLRVTNPRSTLRSTVCVHAAFEGTLSPQLRGAQLSCAKAKPHIELGIGDERRREIPALSESLPKCGVELRSTIFLSPACLVGCVAQDSIAAPQQLLNWPPRGRVVSRELHEQCGGIPCRHLKLAWAGTKRPPDHLSRSQRDRLPIGGEAIQSRTVEDVTRPRRPNPSAWSLPAQNDRHIRID